MVETKIPSSLTSCLRALATAFIECFVAAYQPSPARETCATTEVVMRILPERCLRICGRAALMQASTPKTFTAKICCTCSLVISSTVEKLPKPAFATKRSSRPSFFMSASTADLVFLASVTSKVTGTAPNSFVSATALESLSAA